MLVIEAGGPPRHRPTEPLVKIGSTPHDRKHKLAHPRARFALVIDWRGYRTVRQVPGTDFQAVSDLETQRRRRPLKVVDQAGPTITAFVIANFDFFAYDPIEPLFGGTWMQTIGLIGGMSWESTAIYYKVINERIRDRMGQLHSAPLLMYSYDFQEIKEMQYADRWGEAATSLAEIARRLESAGARAIVLCTNTMHKLVPDIRSKLTVPFIHIGDATAQRIRAKGYRRVGLLGTKFTMEEDFYSDRLRAHDLDVMVPPADERADVNRIIYDELCVGIVAAPSRRRYQEVMAALVASGAECIILGCTEITMLVGPGDTSVETFDTTVIHAEAAADFAIG